MSVLRQPTTQQVRLALLLTGLGGLLFTLDLPLLRLSFADQWTMVFTRGIFLFIAITSGWGFGKLTGRQEAPFISGWAGIAVALTSTLGNTAYIGAVTHTDAANVVFIIALTPLLAAALSRLLLGERIHAITWGATLSALLGAALIASHGFHTGNWAGDALAFISAFCSAAIFTIIRATKSKVATSLALGSLSSALLALALFGVSLHAILAPGALGIPAWCWLGLNGLVAIPLATVLLARGPRVLPSADVGMFFMLETVLTPVWIWLLFGEVPSSRVMLGGAIIIITLVSHSIWRIRGSWSESGQENI